MPGEKNGVFMIFCEETSGRLTVKLRNPSEPGRLQHFLTLSYGTLNPCSFVKLWIALKDTPCKVQVSFFSPVTWNYKWSRVKKRNWCRNTYIYSNDSSFYVLYVSRLQNVNNLTCVIIHMKKPSGKALIFRAVWQMSQHAETCTECTGHNGVVIKSSMLSIFMPLPQRWHYVFRLSVCSILMNKISQEIPWRKRSTWIIMRKKSHKCGIE